MAGQSVCGRKPHRHDPSHSEAQTANTIRATVPVQAWVPYRVDLRFSKGRLVAKPIDATIASQRLVLAGHLPHHLTHHFKPSNPLFLAGQDPSLSVYCFEI